MPRLRMVSVALISGICLLGLFAASPFDEKLQVDRRIIHALNRLTFGPRPGDVDAVRAIGLDKWIDQQLHPERIPENSTLTERLRPFETLRMDPAQIAKEYAQPQSTVVNPQLKNLISNADQTRFLYGTAEERAAILSSMDPEKRAQVYLAVPPATLASLPQYQKEADEARKARAQAIQKEAQMRSPQLMDLLTPEQIAMTKRSGDLRSLMDSLDHDRSVQVAGALPPQMSVEYPDLWREAMKSRAPLKAISGDLKSGKVLRAVYSDRQLEEVLTDFWFNHFNVYENKQVLLANNSYRALLASYENGAIRPHVLGKFRDLLIAVAHHPAMLYYLDNWESVATDAQDRIQVGPFARSPGFVITGNVNQARGLNENYGRELMELHTLGVNGGYTQQDVVEVARCFTGWTVRKPDEPVFAFVDFMHDKGAKTVLGHTIAAGGGENDGLQVIDILAAHPSTAKFISRELAQRFVADDPPSTLVDRMAATFRTSGGDLRAVMQTMFASPEFFSGGSWQAKIKSPFEMVVSTLRATGANLTEATVVAQRISDFGEPLYGKIEPNGYPNTGELWLSSTDLLGRIAFAGVLASGSLPGAKVDTSRWDGKDGATIAREILGHDLSTESLAALTAAGTSPAMLAGAILGSPEFNRR